MIIGTLARAMRRLDRILVALAACAAMLARPASAIDARCSACRGVGRSLAAALRADRESVDQKVVDMRGRLDSKGQRYGKRISYRESELRFEELLEGVCKEDGEVGKLQLHEETNRWRTPPNPVKKIRQARGKRMKDEILAYCHRVIESTEDALREAVYADAVDETSVEEFLCRRASKECDADVDFTVEEPKENELYTDENDTVEVPPPSEKTKKTKKRKVRAKVKSSDKEL